MAVDESEFTTAMARLSAHVTIVTAYDQQHRPRGFTASALCSLSLRPPLLLVCVARAAMSHEAFIAADHFAVNVLSDSHRALAERFAAPGLDRFATSDFVIAACAPQLVGALSVMICSRHATHPGGDHTILVGQVELVTRTPGAPLIYFDRQFCGLGAAV